MMFRIYHDSVSFHLGWVQTAIIQYLIIKGDINHLMLEKVKTGLITAFRETWQFLKSTIFLKNFGIFLVLAFLGIFITKIWLNWYTNHGQALKVPDFIQMDFDEATRLADKNSFELVVSDSVFLLNQAPHRILVQDPPANFKVKEHRKIYVTVTKTVPDLVKVPNLLAGNDDYKQYSRKLERIGVAAKVVDRKYSIKLERNTILEIRFDGENITEKVGSGFKVPMGSTLEFVVTDRGGGMVEVPNLICKSYDAAKFLIKNYGLKVGNATVGAKVKNPEEAYVSKQNPAYRPGAKMDIGATIDVQIVGSLPKNCAGGDDYSGDSQ